MNNESFICDCGCSYDTLHNWIYFCKNCNNASFGLDFLYIKDDKFLFIIYNIKNRTFIDLLDILPLKMKKKYEFDKVEDKKQFLLKFYENLEYL